MRRVNETLTGWVTKRKLRRERSCTVRASKFANGAVSAAFAAAVSAGLSSSSDETVVVTGDAEVDPNSLTGARPEFFDSNGRPYSKHDTLEEALQAGEDASRAARAASGTNNEYGVATIQGDEAYYNSLPVTSNSPDAIKWIIQPASTGIRYVALNHLHPGTGLDYIQGFSQQDKDTYRTMIRNEHSGFTGMYMFDSRGNWRYAKSPGGFGYKTTNCGRASSTVWSC